MNLHALIADALKEKVENITDASSTKTLRSWSSMKHVSLVMALEKAFGLKFTVAEIVMLKSVREISEVFMKRGVTFS